MAVYIVTGKLGSGKTLAAVGRIRDYLRRGARVATNLDINMPGFGNPMSRAWVHRLPDHPTRSDLDLLGTGQDGLDEEKNGLLVLDECATWLNSRDWSDKGRQAFIDWALHSRKLGWDLMLIVQDISTIDKQVRTSLAEFHVIVKRLDRLAIPFIGGFFKMFGMKVRPPKIHAAFVKYGTDIHAPISDRWLYRGRDLYTAYDTKQVFKHDQLINGVSVPNVGNHCTLSAWHLQGRYLTQKRPLWHWPVLLVFWFAFNIVEQITMLTSTKIPVRKA